MPIAEITAVFALLKTAIDTLKGAKDLLPTEKRKLVEQTLLEAEQASEFARLKIIQELGGQLCFCTEPPQVMKEIIATTARERRFECQGCGQQRRIPIPGWPR